MGGWDRGSDGFNCNKSTASVILDGEGVGEGERGLVGRATARVTYEESATGVATSTSTRESEAPLSRHDFFWSRTALHVGTRRAVKEREKEMDISVIRRDRTRSGYVGQLGSPL